MRGSEDTPLRPGPPSTMTMREPSGACSVTIGDCSSSRDSATPIDRVSRRWNAYSSSAESHSWPSVLLAPVGVRDPRDAVRVDVDLLDVGIVHVRLQRTGARPSRRTPRARSSRSVCSSSRPSPRWSRAWLIRAISSAIHRPISSSRRARSSRSPTRRCPSAAANPATVMDDRSASIASTSRPERLPVSSRTMTRSTFTHRSSHTIAELVAGSRDVVAARLKRRRQARSSDRISGDRRKRIADPARPASTAAAHGSSASATTASAWTKSSDLVDAVRTGADQGDDGRDRAHRQLRSEVGNAFEAERRCRGRTPMLAVGDDDQSGLADQRREPATQPTAVGDDDERVERREHRQHRRRPRLHDGSRLDRPRRRDQHVHARQRRAAPWLRSPATIPASTMRRPRPGPATGVGRARRRGSRRRDRIRPPCTARPRASRPRARVRSSCNRRPQQPRGSRCAAG